MKMKSLLISEIFGPTIQGEGALIGRPTVFVRTGGCDFRCNWCIAPDTPLLMSDFSEKVAAKIRVGDGIVGMKRRSGVPEAIGPYVRGEVLATQRRMAPCLDVVFCDGRSVRVSESHRFTKYRTGRFVCADELQIGDQVRALNLCQTFREDRAYKAGYLSGAADGDGSFHSKNQGRVRHFVIATKDDCILQRFRRYACDLGFRLQEGRHLSGGQFAPARHINCLRLTVTPEAHRFESFLHNFKKTPDFWRGYLAGIYDTDGSTDGQVVRICQFKPRIKEKIQECLSALGLSWIQEEKGFRIRGGRGVFRQIIREIRPTVERKSAPFLFSRGGTYEFVRVAQVVPAGLCEVVSIQTDIGTYVANGLLSKNCDSLYAVLPEHKNSWRRMEAREVLDEVEQKSGGAPILVTVSGGNPALAPLGELLDLGHARGHTFALETQGTKAPDWLARLDYLVVSPKPPSSGMEFSPEKLARVLEVASGENGPHISLKVVVFDEADYAFARRVHELHPQIPFFLSIGNDAPLEGVDVDFSAYAARVEWLLARCARDGWFSPTILPQFHVLLWGNKRGV